MLVCLRESIQALISLSRCLTWAHQAPSHTDVALTLEDAFFLRRQSGRPLN